MAANENEDVIYASGVDPTIVHFQPVQKGTRSKWMKSIQRQANTHDVHAMLNLTGIRGVVSIGIDANLFVDDPKFKSLKSYPPFQAGTSVALAPNAGIFALKYEQNIEVWKLGQSAKTSFANDTCHPDGLERKPLEILKLTEEPLKVLDIKVKETETIADLAIAPNGDYLAYSTKDKFKILKIGTDPPKIDKVNLNIDIMPTLFKFSDDKLLICDAYGAVQVLDLITETSVQVLVHKNAINHIDIAKDASIIVISDFENNIEIYETKNSRIQCKIPMYKDAPIACLALHPNLATLMVVYSNHHFVECCTKTGKYTKLTNTILEQRQVLPKEWKNKHKTTKGILFPQSHLNGNLAKKNDTIIFYDEEFIGVLDKTIVMDIAKGVLPTSNKQAKTDKKTKNQDLNHISKEVLRLSKRYEHLVFLGALKAENMEDATCPLVAVEVKPQVLERQLPPSIRQKKFGAM